MHPLTIPSYRARGVRMLYGVLNISLTNTERGKNQAFNSRRYAHSPSFGRVKFATFRSTTLLASEGEISCCCPPRRLILAVASGAFEFIFNVGLLILFPSLFLSMCFRPTKASSWKFCKQKSFIRRQFVLPRSRGLSRTGQTPEHNCTLTHSTIPGTILLFKPDAEDGCFFFL